jgi:hypothetical protein
MVAGIMRLCGAPTPPPLPPAWPPLTCRCKSDARLEYDLDSIASVLDSLVIPGVVQRTHIRLAAAASLLATTLACCTHSTPLPPNPSQPAQCITNSLSSFSPWPSTSAMFLLMMVCTSLRSAVRAAMLRWLRVSWNSFFVFWINVSATRRHECVGACAGVCAHGQQLRANMAA